MRLTALALALFACNPDGDSGAPLAGSPTGSPTGSTSTTTGPLSHADDIQKIWNKHCGTQCHLNDNDGDLSLFDAYDQIVGVPSSDVPSMNLIEPGSPDDSYLWHKLEGTQGSVGGAGFPMPRGTDLGNAKRNKIKQWIEEGALP